MTLRSTCSAEKKVSLRCRQSEMKTWPRGRDLDRLAQRVDVVGIVDEDLDRLRAAFHVEVELRLGERHEDDGGVELRHADLEDGDDRIGLDARRRAERRHVAVRRDQRDHVAEHEAEIVRPCAGRWRRLRRLVEADERALLDVAGDDGELAEIVAADAAHQRAGPCPDRARGQHLPVDQRDRVFDAGNAVDALGDRCIVVERHVDRLHDQMAVDAEDAGQQLGAKAVHHRHDDDERRDAEHDAEEGDRGDHRDHRLLAPRAQIAPGDHAARRPRTAPRRRASLRRRSFIAAAPKPLRRHRRSAASRARRSCGS